MEVISRIISSMSAAWVSWVMLVMLVLMAFNRYFVTDLLLVFRTMFSRSERLYLDSSWQGKILAWLFRCGVIAMAIYLMQVRELGGCLMGDYCVALGLIGGMMLVQYGLEKLVCVVFLSAKQSDLIFEQRSCICNAVALVLWLCVLVMQWVDNVMIMNSMCYTLATVYVGLLLVKSVQLLYRNILSIFYILLYIISLEVVPLVATYFLIKDIL